MNGFPIEIIVRDDLPEDVFLLVNPTALAKEFLKKNIVEHEIEFGEYKDGFLEVKMRTKIRKRPGLDQVS